MATTIPNAREVVQDLHFPKAGIDLSLAYAKQPAREVFDGTYARTTVSGVNVRSFEPFTGHCRGGQRAGLTKYIPVQVSGAHLIQLLAPITTDTSPGGNVQQNQSGRVVTLIAVSQGNVFAANSGDTGWTAATNNTGFSPPLNATGVVYSAPNLQKLWFADGSNWAYYVPATNSVETWVAGAGTLPVDSAGNKPRLIETWRGRTCVSGLLFDPQNWFMSAVGDPTNFDYSPKSQTPTQAIAGNNSPLGLVGDVITTLIPFNDDILVFGGDHTIWMLRGDPFNGGQIDRVSDTIGMAWGIPWCKDPYGAIYFVSNQMGIYKLVPGAPPIRVSQAIEQLVTSVDTGVNTIRLVWDDRFQGLHVFITPTAAAGATTHLFWEQRVGAWWQDTFPDNNFNPLATCTFDGNLPGDRRALLGSWDGYVRYFSPNGGFDDGTNFTSSVVIGPLLTPNLDDMLLKDLQAVLGASSGPVTYAVHVGTTAEAALLSTPVATGTWTLGRNTVSFIRRSGYAVYVKLSAATGQGWQLESIRCRVATQGRVRQRGK